MRLILLLLLSFGTALGQPITSQTFIKGNPPGGIGGACSPNPLVGYLDSSGRAITCPVGTLIWTVLAGGGGTPGGSTNAVQTNNSGAFGGPANLTNDGATVVLNRSTSNGGIGGQPSAQIQTFNSLGFTSTLVEPGTTITNCCGNYQTGRFDDIYQSGLYNPGDYGNLVGETIRHFAFQGHNVTTDKKTIIGLNVDSIHLAGGQSSGVGSDLQKPGVGDALGMSAIVHGACLPTAGGDEGCEALTARIFGIFAARISVISGVTATACSTTMSIASVTALAAAITTTGQTAITVNSGAAITNRQIISIDSELFIVDSGGGTVNLVVERGSNSTTPATHTNGTAVYPTITKSGGVTDPRTFSVASTAGCNVGDYVTLEPGVSVLDTETGPITAVGSGTLTMLLNSPHINGGGVVPAPVVAGTNLCAGCEGGPGQGRFVVDKSGSTYSTGNADATTGLTTITGHGTTWSSTMVGQNATLPGCLKFTGDDYTGNGFTSAEMWFPIANASATSISLAVTYTGTAKSGAAYVIAPCARIGSFSMTIGATSETIAGMALEGNGYTWTVGHNVLISLPPNSSAQAVILAEWNQPYPMLFGGPNMVSIQNNGVAKAARAIDISPTLSDSSTTAGYSNGIAFRANTDNAQLALSGRSLSSTAITIGTFGTGTVDNGAIQWIGPTNGNASIGPDLTGTFGYQIDSANQEKVSFRSVGFGGTALFDYSGISTGVTRTYTLPDQSGAVALTLPGTLTRTVPSSNSSISAIELGTLTPANGQDATMFVSIVSAGLINYQYSFALSYNTPAGVWTEVAPTSKLISTGATVLLALDIKPNADGTYNLRIRRVDNAAGTVATTVFINTYSIAATTFTATSAISSGLTAPTTYLASAGIWPNTFVLGKTPTVALTIDPSGLTASRTLTTPDSAGLIGVVTGSPANNDCTKFNVAGGVTTVVTAGAPCGTVTAVNGTANQVTSSGGATPTLTLPAVLTLPGTVNKITLTPPTTAWTIAPAADNQTTTIPNGTLVANGGPLGTPSSGVGTNLTGTAAGLTSGISQALKSATTTVDVSASTAPSKGQALVATDSTHATWQTATPINVRVYGAVGAARSSATGSCTSGSATLTDPAAPFLSTDPGNLIAIAGAGAGSNNTLLSTNLGQGTGAISAASSNGGKIQITFAAGAVGQGSTLASGNRIYLSNATGGLAVGEFYAGSVTATTAVLFTDPALTVGTTFTSTGTGNINWGNIDLETTISSFTNATTVTLATTCGTTVSSVTYRQGVDDGPAITSAIAASAASPGAQVYIPRGNYMIGSTATAVAPAVPVFSNCAVFTSGNGITIYGDGRGETFLWAHKWRSPTVCLTGTDVRLAGMTIYPAIPVGQRDSNQISSHGVLIDTLNSIAPLRITVDNVEVGYTAQGITIANGCTVCVVQNSYVHDDLANATLMAATVGAVSRSGFINMYVENTRDAGYSFDSPTSGSAPLTDTFCINCRVYNGGASGMEITGATRMKISGFHSSSTYGPGIRIIGNAGYADTNDVQIVDAQIEGAGTGATFAGQTNFEPQACLWIGAKATGINIKNTQIGLLKCDAIGASKTQGPYLGTFITGSSTIVGLSVGFVDGSGGNTVVNGQDGSKFQRNAGIEIYGVQDFRLGGAYLRSTYEDGLFIDSTSTGTCNVGAVMVNTPNTSATGSVYALNVQGCTKPTYQNVSVSNTGTLAGNVNCVACGSVDVTTSTNNLALFNFTASNLNASGLAGYAASNNAGDTASFSVLGGSLGGGANIGGSKAVSIGSDNSVSSGGTDAITITPGGSAITAALKFTFGVNGVLQSKYLKGTSTAPVLSACGTSPTIVGTDLDGTVTEGTIATGCTITFSATLPNTPHCTLTSESGLVFTYTQNTTAITVTNVGALSSTKLDYTCGQ